MLMSFEDALSRLERVQLHGSYATACCPACGDRHPSLSVKRGSDGAAAFRCFKAGCRSRNIAAALRGEPVKRWLVLPVGEPQAGTDDAKRVESARRIWREARRATGSIVEAYLCSRAIVIPPPPSIRFAPSLKHRPSGTYAPAMVCAVQSRFGTVTGVQRIYLKVDGSGKASFALAKMSLGTCAGGAVRLAAAADKVVLAEGVETGLSILQATGIPAWATLGTSGLRAVQIPDEVRDVITAADGDEAGEKAANDAAFRFIREGRRARIARPPRGSDFNDMVRIGS